MTYRPRPFSLALILFGAAGLIMGALETWIAVFHYPWIPFRGGADRFGYLVFFLFLNGVAGALYGLLAAVIPAGLGLVFRGRRLGETPARQALRAVRGALDWGMIFIGAIGLVAYHRLLVHLDKNPFERNNLRYLAIWLGLLAVTWLVVRLLLRFIPWQRVRPVHAVSTLVFFILAVGLGMVLHGDSASVADSGVPAAVETTAGEALPVIEGQGRPSLLFITIDTLRADHVGAYGYQRYTSPYMDRFSQDAMLFQTPVAQKTMTAPSFATMMTGLYPRTHGLSRNHGVLSDESNTLAERLKEAGYRTAAFVSNPACSDVFNFDQGFDFFDLTFYDEEVESRGLNEKFIPYARNLGQEPFLLWLHYTDPHALYVVEEPEYSLFTDDYWYGKNRDRKVEIGPRARPYILPTEVLLREPEETDYSVDLDFYISQYDAEIRYNDFHLQYAMAVMEQMGLLENTLVVLLADHGESLVEHNFYMSHGHNTYNTQAVVPLMIRHDALPRGTVIPQKVELVDLLPTMLTLLGVPYDTFEMEGRSQVPLMTGQGVGSPEDAFTYIEGKYDYYYSHVAVWGDRWKLIISPLKMAYPLNRIVDLRVRFWLGGHVDNRFRTKVLVYELYDMQADPGETNNLAGTGLAAEVEERERLFRWLDRHPLKQPQQFLSKDELRPDVVDQLKALGYVHS
jgi:arylsulfatase A-like enzyme